MDDELVEVCYIAETEELISIHTHTIQDWLQQFGHRLQPRLVIRVNQQDLHRTAA